MPDSPLISVICLSHNHVNYVAEAIQSVWDQDYTNTELIVVDDASGDGTKEAIQQKLSGSNTTFLALDQNVGNCKAFNLGLAKSSGAYVIDLAADDALSKNRISQGLSSFTDEKIGVNFCDAQLIDRDGIQIGTHYSRSSDGSLNEQVPAGEIYVELIRRYFICPPTMMIKREVLNELGGYDESLSYEDFDFWIRSAREWHYSFSDEILVKRRILKNSHSRSQFKLFSKHQRSTLEVCRKIKALNRSPKEDEALKQRCGYEIRQCLKQGNWGLIPQFLRLNPS